MYYIMWYSSSCGKKEEFLIYGFVASQNANRQI